MNVSSSFSRPCLLARLGLALGVVIISAGAVGSARANVFASQLRLGGSSTNLQTTAGQSVVIAYLLNQNADLGVTAFVHIGTNVVWATNVAGGSAGTLVGTNLLVWPGKDSNGNVVTNGNWSVSVTAKSAGSTNWSQIPMKTNSPVNVDGHGYVYSSFGIAVNNNTDSLEFGRIFVGNAVATGVTNDVGDLKGIGKYNADGSYAAEGAYSTGGWMWNVTDDPFSQSPLKIEVGADDHVYVGDGASACTVLSFDQFITTNTPPLLALQTNNMVNFGVNYAGLFVAGTGTNRQVYMTDIDAGGPNGVGVRRWDVTSSGVVASNDFGTTVILASTALPLNLFPQDVALDSSNRIFVIQQLSPSSLETNRVLAFPPYSGTPLATPLWTVTSTNLVDAFGVAAALHTNFIAVVCRNAPANAISIFNSDTGAEILVPGLNNGSPDYTDVAWDRAGNLYVTDWQNSRWTVFSPPGTNQFQTVSVQTVKVGSYARPTLVAPQWSSGQFQVTLVGEIGVNYAVETSSNLVSWAAITTNRALTTTNVWTVPASGGRASFRARIVP